MGSLAAHNSGGSYGQSDLLNYPQSPAVSNPVGYPQPHMGYSAPYHYPPSYQSGSMAPQQSQPPAGGGSMGGQGGDAGLGGSMPQSYYNTAMPPYPPLGSYPGYMPSSMMPTYDMSQMEGGTTGAMGGATGGMGGSDHSQGLA